MLGKPHQWGLQEASTRCPNHLIWHFSMGSGRWGVRLLPNDKACISEVILQIKLAFLVYTWLYKKIFLKYFFEVLFWYVFCFREEAWFHIWQQELPQYFSGSRSGNYSWGDTCSGCRERSLGHFTGTVKHTKIVVLQALMVVNAVSISCDFLFRGCVFLFALAYK